jgi:hypothetical protein
MTGDQDQGDRADGGRWHHGTDPSGRVGVSVDDTGLDVRVRLSPRWRSAGDVGVAVVEAHRAATTARLEAWAAGAFDLVPPVPPSAPPRLDGSLGEQLRTVSRAFRDLDEFGIALAELNRRTVTVTDQGGHVRASVQGGAIVAVEVDATWVPQVGDGDVAARIGQALRAALRHTARAPERALQGCPDLADVFFAGGRTPAFLTTGPERSTS